MRAGPFISLIAEAYRVEEATVIVFARSLREAGLLTTGARGVNAPHMTPLDAARLTIALLATDRPARAVERVRRFAPMVLQPGAPDHPALSGDAVTLEGALARLFTYAAGAENALDVGAPYVELHENAKRATLTIDGARPAATFRDAARTGETKTADARELFGIRRTRGLAAVELMAVAVALWADAKQREAAA